MRNSLARVVVVLVAVAFVAVPMAAESYVVTLKNGTTFSTRYKPQEASWDHGKVLLLTEWGNPISLAKSDIDTVISEFEKTGFGRVINNTTVELGAAPNDAEVPGKEATGSAGALQALQQMMQQQAGSQPVYNQQQFVEPGSTSGMPLSYIGAGGQTPPMGGVINVTAPPTPAPAPTPPPQ
jgi:hypothetical protein